MTHSQILRFLIPLCLVSCNSPQIEKEFPTNEEQVAIGFKASFYQSRAIATLTEVQSNGFAVWGGYDGNNLFDYDNDGNPVKVTYNSSTQEWGYGTSKYWELDKQYTFFATYPYDKYNGSVTNENGTYMVTIETPEDADTDYLTASAYADPNSANFNPEVALQFTHLMTRVNIKVAQDFTTNENDDFTVTKVTLTGIKPNGNYQVTNAGTTSTGTWIMENATTSFERTFSETEQKTIRNQTDQILSVWGENGLLLIPQAITSASVKVRIDYLFSMYQSEEEPKESSVEAYLPASADLWQSGKIITYSTIISNENNISFLAPTVEPWGTPQSGGTIIIK